LEVESAYTNEFAARREAVSYYLTRMVEGRPAFIISPRCTLLRKGFLGRYSYRKMRVSGTERFSDKPNKDLYSHPHDALQYVALFFRGNSDISGAANFGASKRREIKTVSLNPKDAQLLESRAFSVEEICRWFRVDPSMIGHGNAVSNWGTGLEQKMIGFLTFTLRPILTRIEQAINNELIPVEDRDKYYNSLVFRLMIKKFPGLLLCQFGGLI
ncbi:phage portal protein, partial [Candidatus Falkowbacteria bacterium]|nr:phage portal protein [Candidatus Falkowbacteria bacterium]